MNFVSSINHRVSDVEKTSTLLCKYFGFIVEITDDDSITISNGVLLLRLTKIMNGQNDKICFDYQVGDLESVNRELRKIGFSSNDQIEKVSQFRHQIRMKGEDTIDVLLYKLFDEDDLGILIDLPVSLEWEPRAIKIVQQLLKDVPLEFRDQARKKAVEGAEAIVMVEGIVIVDFDTALQAFVQGTPAFKREELFVRLKELSIDVAQFSESNKE